MSPVGADLKSLLTINARLMSDGRYHRLRRSEEVIHCIGGVSEYQFVVLLRNDVLFPSHHGWVVLKELQQMVDGQL